MTKRLFPFPKNPVYLVGAGPGDPKLLTLKGRECLAQADVVVFDRLVNHSLLNHVRKDAELIYAGKCPDNHILEQDQINATLAAHARQGKVVVRLKGGDPFLFGRGGEEAEYLEEQGIPYEVVPGVTSAIAVPAYAGIPVTHRDITSALSIITGNEKPNQKDSKINWQCLVDENKTLVFLMGRRNLPLIVAKLLSMGMPKEIPAAIISWGTTPEQKTVVGELDNIVGRADEAEITHPAIIVIGQVVKLREKLQWFEKKPLFGKRIVVTRPREQAEELSNRLADLGGEPVIVPTIAIAPPEDYSLFDQALANIKTYDWVIFTSVNGVKAFFQRIGVKGYDIRKLFGLKIAAIGPVTRRELENYRLLVDYVPTEYRAEAMIEDWKNHDLSGKRFLLPRADIGRSLLPDFLRSKGAVVHDVAAYRTIKAKTDYSFLYELLHKGKIHLVTFTSSSTVKHFLDAFSNPNEKALLKELEVACIGPVTAATARQAGLNVQAVAEEYTIDGLVNAILAYYYPQEF
ncbi:MAG TPA: uroporphyrinogen-III C-methyltransferase [Clostridia bacterium]|nr:uroporphyrinogen-III C-methyltransferase [Clostridia bacterium]